jgi:hypothetical protein
MILFSHENQAISLQGKIKDRTNKDLSWVLKMLIYLELLQIINLSLKVNCGQVDFKQNNAVYKLIIKW